MKGYNESMKTKLYAMLVILSGIFWGSSCLFVDKLTSLGYSSLHCTAIRIVICAIILNVALIVKGKGFALYRVSLRSLVLCALSGIFSVLAMCIFYYSCLTETAAAVGAILLYTAPIFVMIMSLIFFKEKMTLKKIAAFFIALIGCALVSGIATGATASALGILFGVLSGFCYSLYGILTALYMKKASEPLTFTALSFAFATLGALVVCEPLQIVKHTATLEGVPLLILFFVVFSLCTAVMPFALYTKGLVGVRPDVASILAFSEPLTAAVFGIVILKQPFDGFQTVGILLVITAIIVLEVNVKGKKDKM